MTHETKENILEYLIGKLNMESGNDAPQFLLQNDIINNYNNFIDENFPNKSFNAVDYIQPINSDNIIVYGSYAGTKDSNNIYEMFGGIIILDENLMPVQALLEYESGTKFRKFEILAFNEENTIYGVDNEEKHNGENSTNKYRFIMLNNIINSTLVFDEYKVILRQSYNFPAEYNNLNFGYNSDKKNRLLKSTKESTYLFVCWNFENRDTVVIQLKVNVGSENEWKSYNLNNDFGLTYIDSLVDWTNENPILKIYGSFSNNSDSYYIEAELENEIFTTKKTIKLESKPQVFSILAKSEEEVFLGVGHREITENSDNEISKILKVSNDNNSFVTIFTDIKPFEYLGNAILFQLKNNNIFVKRYVWLDIENVENFVGMIIDDVFYDKSIGISTWGSLFDLFFVKNVFNLYTVFFQGENSLLGANVAYNSLQYNGLPYKNTDSIVPNSVNIFDENEKIIFARNLYNKVINNNITQSTVEVPNTILNNTILNTQKLLSKTNEKILDNVFTLTKNVYETLYINFYNILSIKNANKPTNEIINIDGAIRLNKSISDLTDYMNCRATKLKIYYDDNTSYIRTLQSKEITNNVLKSIYNFTVFVPKDKIIVKIDIISQDESTIFQSIENINLESGKLYNIQQTVEIL